MIPIDGETINYRDELVRKLIHLFSLSIPIVYYFISRETAILILGILTSAALFIDLGRYFSPSLGKIFYKIFGFLLRKHEVNHEKKNLNGATYVLMSALICVIILPKVLFITAFSILIISDSLAALIGRRFGRRKFLSKSFEGTLAFFISASIVIFFTPKVHYGMMEYVIGFIAAFVGGIIENISF
ncbi:MAG: dolichol kinase, partial [Ignavibacteria bacterium]|nr:dolichol kinase [Ignavibacteria bacterium]